MTSQLYADDTAQVRATLAAALRPDTYLTDGQSLFRLLESRDGSEVMLEDCLSLELILCQLDDLVRSHVRVVR